MLIEDKPKVYKAALYIRLSREDGDKLESNSVKNQRDLIHFYLKDKKDIIVICEKVDDGYSGVTFDRPALKELLEEVKRGIVNCIIVKDLSRFGRNFIEAGRYIEQIFPFLGVRFIAINDNIDTAKGNVYENGFLVPFKNLMNDSYSRDISIKSRTQLAIRQKQGDFVGAFPVYGYLRSKEDKHKLVVDEVAGETVKEIFSMRMAGYHNHFISEYLNQLGVPCPLAYKELLKSNYTTPFKLNPRAKWSPMAIDRILKNELYAGVMIQGKETTLNYKMKKRIKRPRKEWVRVENTHKAIISKEDFEVVQQLMINDTRTSPLNEKVYLLSGLLKCGECGSNMVRKTVKAREKAYVYYICSKNKENKKECSSHRIRDCFVEEAILSLLEKQISIFFTQNKHFTEVKQEQKWQGKKERLERQCIVHKGEELEKYQRLKNSLYEDYREGVLTREEYRNMKAYYEKICGDIEENINTSEIKMTKRHEDRFLPEYPMESKLDRTALVLLVEKIIVYDNSKIRVVLKYRNDFKNVQKH
ncbi:recombinase family protein [Anaerotignum sp. MB30-C6]|uniref:recombinase family protein n=1 Tax=Anaerotignum sp. MB30-C6 TaxID=3070814 RepID=UPI0027DE6B6C|nr:recombinase family protein [Anaerotignum sp. MB30-C6]WMI82310.1 recombinase family protein [Anaerotignum sp. MB30-C6]